MRKYHQPRIPIIFQEQKNTTKTKLAKLLKQYNACMVFNPDQNTYEVDVEVKFNSIGQKMQFMQNYLKKPRQDSVLEEQEYNNSKKYLTELKEQKALINLSSIKKNQQLEYSISQSEFNSIKTENKHGQLIDSVIEEDYNNLNFQQLKLRIQESIDRSCQQILLMKIRPDMARNFEKDKQSNLSNGYGSNSNQFSTVKQNKRQIPDYRLGFSGKSKQEIIQEINKDLIVSNKQHQQHQFGGIIMQQNMLFEQSDEQDSSYKIGASKDSQLSHPSNSISKNNQSNMMSSGKRSINSEQKKLNQKQKQKEKEKQKDRTKISEAIKISQKQHKTDIQTKKINSIANKPNNAISKQQYHKMMAQKQSNSNIKSKNNTTSRQPKSKIIFSQQKQPAKFTPPSINSNRSNYDTKTTRPNKIQHEQFKNFLISHRQKLDKIVHGYNKNHTQILIQDESIFDSMNTSKDFSTKIIEEYRQKIQVNNQNMSSSEMIGYFKFLIRHAKGLYHDFQKERR